MLISHDLQSYNTLKKHFCIFNFAERERVQVWFVSYPGSYNKMWLINNAVKIKYTENGHFIVQLDILMGIVTILMVFAVVCNCAKSIVRAWSLLATVILSLKIYTLIEYFDFFVLLLCTLPSRWRVEFRIHLSYIGIFI